MTLLARRVVRVFFLIAILASFEAYGVLEQPSNAQSERERELEAVVRNKTFFKTGHFELTATGGTMPYDSAVSHTIFGGRLTWHFSDHFSWEIVDAQIGSASIPSFTTDLVSQKGLSNVQVVALKTLASTGIVMSPLYGKIRLFGATVMYFDIYAVLGFGMANTNTLKFETPNTNGAVAVSIAKAGWDPLINAGIGMRIFLTSFMGLVVDFRDYMTYSETYGNKTLKNNFSVGAGLSFYLPTF